MEQPDKPEKKPKPNRYWIDVEPHVFTHALLFFVIIQLWGLRHPDGPQGLWEWPPITLLIIAFVVCVVRAVHLGAPRDHS